MGKLLPSAHDMGREHRIQAALAPVFPYVATMVAMCDDPSVLGGDFYVMERIVGTVPRREMPVDLSADGGAFGVPYSVETVLDEFTMPAMVFEDGELREVPAGSGVIDGRSRRPSPRRASSPTEWLVDAHAESGGRTSRQTSRRPVARSSR